MLQRASHTLNNKHTKCYTGRCPLSPECHSIRFVHPQSAHDSPSLYDYSIRQTITSLFCFSLSTSPFILSVLLLSVKSVCPCGVNKMWDFERGDYCSFSVSTIAHFSICTAYICQSMHLHLSSADSQGSLADLGNIG